jgi:fructokinase
MPNVICVGEVLFDRLADQVGVGLEAVTSWTALAGGAPANVACGLVKLGTNAEFVGCVGVDPAGMALAEKLQAQGVGLRGLQHHPTAPTRQVQVLRSSDGDRTFAGFGGVPTDQFADAYLDLAGIPTPLFTDAQFLVLGTIGLAYPQSHQATWEAVRLAQKHQVAVFVDVNWRPSFWPDPAAAIETIQELLAVADFIKFAQEEAQLIYQQTAPEQLRALLPQATGVIVSDGANSCHYALWEQTGEIPAFAVSAVDTTGAGDAFVAAVVHQLCQGERQAASIVRYAAAAGAITTLQPGAIDAQPSASQVESFLSGHHFL